MIVNDVLDKVVELQDTDGETVLNATVRVEVKLTNTVSIKRWFWGKLVKISSQVLLREYTVDRIFYDRKVNALVFRIDDVDTK